jgi:LCP family protein required for cell wall assembly
MRTTLKRGVGRGATLNGDGRSVFPPATVSSISRYRQPPPPPRSGFALFRRILFATLLVVLGIGGGAAFGAVLWFDESVHEVSAHSVDVQRAQKGLDVKLPGAAAIALVIGYDHRAGIESGLESRSDTIMLLRADPETKTISMLSFPRDLYVEVHCPAKPGRAALPVTHDRINGAYSRCGSGGTLDTVKHLTGLPVNYLITVNFHGFKQIVDKLGGVWLDVDHRYYNKNVGTFETNYANIDLQPGYQRLNATQALEFVRYRHFDSDFVRLARQQQFVRALKEKVAQNSKTDLIAKLPSLVKAITDNVEVGVGGSGSLSGKTVLSYALLAATLPPGHFFQVKLDNLGQDAMFDVLASDSEIQKTVDQFQHPDVEGPKVAQAAALGRRLRTTAPRPQETTVTVLNGNGVPGAAGNTAVQLADRGYKIVEPPNGRRADAPRQNYFHTKIYYDPRAARSRAAAAAMQKLLQPADVDPLPRDRALRALDPGSKLMVVVGQTFHGQLAPAPVRPVVERQQAYVRYDSSTGTELLRGLRGRVPFKLMAPTVLERSSSPSTMKGVRLYWIKKDQKAVRLVFQTGGGEYWGVQETSWADAPVLGDKSVRNVLGDRRTYDFYYNGTKLHMVVLHANGATYWVVNTLLDTLSNKTMIEIAKGLKPLTSGQ